MLERKCDYCGKLRPLDRIGGPSEGYAHPSTRIKVELAKGKEPVEVYVSALPVSEIRDINKRPEPRGHYEQTDICGTCAHRAIRKAVRGLQ